MKVPLRPILSLYIWIYIYMFINTWMHMYIHIYIHIYVCVGVRIISWSWHICAYFCWGSCGITRRVSQCVGTWDWDPYFEARVEWKSHTSRGVPGKSDTETPHYNNSVTIRAVATAILMSSTMSNVNMYHADDVKREIRVYLCCWPTRSENQYRVLDTPSPNFM